MKGSIFFRAALIAASTVVVVILLLVACGGRKHRAPVQPALSVEHPLVAVSTEYSLNDALLRLSALETPEGINAELFQQLKNELAKQLNAKGISKMVSAPPIGDANRVDDLELVDDGAGAYNLTWHYRNAGDYDQSNAVGISDITPIAMHYGETYDIENVNCLLAVIDGDGNSVIDIADITPIAMNFGCECTGYSIEGSNTADGGFTELVTVPFSLAENEGRFLFTVPQPESEFSFLAVAPFDSGNNIGVLSNPVRITRGDWWMFGREPTHSRRSPYVGAQTDTLRWSYETEQVVRSSPAIGIGGTIYVGGADDYLHAVTPDGTLKWEYQTEDRVDSSPAIGEDGTVYVRSWDGYLYALTPDGSLDWKYQTGEVTGNWVDSSPAIGEDGTIYVGSFDGDLCAVKPDGSLKWRFETGNGVYSGPAIGTDGTIYVGSDDHFIYAIKPDGTLKWQFETESYVDASPAIGADGTVYVGSFDGKLYAVKPDGLLRWSYETGATVYSSAAIGEDGTIYVGSADDYLYAIKPDGSLKWRYQTDDNVYSSPAIGADGTIYVGSVDSYLYAITDGETEGVLLWKYETGDAIWSSPAIGGDGTVYVGSNDGSLYAFSETPVENPPSIDWVSPVLGVNGEEVTFSADVQGTTPFAYTWNFGGGAEPNTSDEASPTVILGEIGEYNASLTVTNEFGLDTFEFTLTVTEERPIITWGAPPGIILRSEKHYDYSTGRLVGFSVYEYFEITGCSGEVEISASVGDEEVVDMFMVEEGKVYQLSVYMDVETTTWLCEFLLIFDSPFAALPSQFTIRQYFRFLSLGEIDLALYEP